MGGWVKFRDSGQIITTSPASWSPYMVMESKGIPPTKIPEHSGLGITVICPERLIGERIEACEGIGEKESRVSKLDPMTQGQSTICEIWLFVPQK